MTDDSNVIDFEAATGIPGFAKAEVGMLAAVQTENGWIPCLVAAVDERGLAIRFRRGRNSVLPEDLGWLVDSDRCVPDPKGTLKRLRPLYRKYGEMIFDIARQRL